jgi:hypothetical protein
MGAHRIATFVVALLLALAAPRPAGACSPPGPFNFGGIAPADGATDVPTNTQLRLFFYVSEMSPAETEIQLRPEAGDPVAVTVTRQGSDVGARVVVVQPDAPLRPQTGYEVRTRFKANCTYDCITTEYAALAKFTTGSGPLTTPPAFAGVTGATVRTAVCGGDTCCGPYKAVLMSLDWARGSDPTIAGYHIYRDGELVSPVGLPGGALDCTGRYPFDAFNSFPAVSGRYGVRAVNLAGLEDTNAATVEVTLDCGGVLDAGVADTGADAPAGATPQPGGACAAAAPAPLGAAALALASLLLLVWRRGRR